MVKVYFSFHTQHPFCIQYLPRISYGSHSLFSNTKISPLLRGTLLLTIVGVVTRLIGFFYKIFLSRTIGASALGLYHLAFPLIGLCWAVSSAGFQTATSRFIAAAAKVNAKKYLAAALSLACLLALFSQIILFRYADWLANVLLADARCASLLRILSFTMLPSAIHACINGYYYGQKKTAVPAFGQLGEQLVRVLTVYLMYQIALSKNEAITAVHAAWGIVFSELGGLCISVTAYGFGHDTTALDDSSSSQSLRTAQIYRGLLDMAIPLTLNQALVHLASSTENILIPQQLQTYGCTPEQALSVYGVLTGMVLSVIFFPGVLTNSLAVLLLPSVSEALSKKDDQKIRRTVSRAIFFGLVLGFFFTFVFLLLGNWIGEFVFDNMLAGILIRKLGWLCPMMYVHALLCSVLHGLGRARTVLWINLLASGIRIGAILFLVPHFGLPALLWGILLSQFFAATAAVISCQRYAGENVQDTP